GVCDFRNNSGITPDEEERMNKEVRAMLEHVRPSDVEFFDRMQSEEVSVAAFEIDSFSICQFCQTLRVGGEFIHQMEFTSHRLIIDGSWSIWWDRVTMVEAVTKADPENQFSEA